MAKMEPLHDRFKRLIAGQGLPELELATGLSRDQIRRLSGGNTKTLDMAAGIRLADYLGKSHYEVAGVPEPAKPASTFSFGAIDRRPVGTAEQRALQRLAKPPTPKALPPAQPSPDDAADEDAAADYWAKRLNHHLDDLPEGELPAMRQNASDADQIASLLSEAAALRTTMAHIEERLTELERAKRGEQGPQE